jgi:hypothetical protein
MSSVIECIKNENMIKHYQNLKSLNLDNEELKNTIEQFNTKLSNESKKIHLPIPMEIMNNFNKKPWIRIPYPIRELKLVEFMKEKKYTTIQKDTILKLLYEKKLTNKIVTYNTETGKIEEITLEN